MTTFSVDPTELQELASTTRGLSEELDPSRVRHASLDGCAGNTSVQWAVDEFSGTWDSGLETVRENLGILADRLDGAASAYAASEDSVKGAASELTSALQPTAAKGAVK